MQSTMRSALVIKKVYKDVPILWILISVQFMELHWARSTTAFASELRSGKA